MEDHTFLTHFALQNSRILERHVYNTDIPAVPLERFIRENASELGPFFDTIETLLWQTVRRYRFTPDALRFERNRSAEPVARFCSALRINPAYRPMLYLKQLPSQDLSGSRQLNFAQVTAFSFPYPYARFTALYENEAVSSAAVLTSASDEPDYGMDLGLFSDNSTQAGKRYAFGPQPFGNPKVAHSSQAPFHMAFFHESPLVYLAGAKLKNDLPIMRVVQFASLAAFAFERGCPYWGYRFAGWALHYVQDLTMPYHASVLPGASIRKLLSIGIARYSGLNRIYDRAVGEVTEKHVRMEALLREWLQEALREGGENRQLLHALSEFEDPPHGGPATAEPPFDIADLRRDISRNAAALGSAADASLNVVNTSPEDLRGVFRSMLLETGRVTRAFTRWCSSLRPQTLASHLQKGRR